MINKKYDKTVGNVACEKMAEGLLDVHDFSYRFFYFYLFIAVLRLKPKLASNTHSGKNSLSKILSKFEQYTGRSDYLGNDSVIRGR